MVQVVRQPRGHHAHRVHALLVQARLAIAPEPRVGAELSAHVVRGHHHRRAGGGAEPLDPQLDDYSATLETADTDRLALLQQVAGLDASQLAQGGMPDLRMGAAGPAPFARSGFQLAEERVGERQAVPPDERQGGLRAAPQPAEEGHLVPRMISPLAVHGRAPQPAPTPAVRHARDRSRNGRA